MAENHEQTLVDPSAHLIYQAITELGWDNRNPGDIVKRVQRLALGLPAEDELSVVLTWLGKCQLIHKLDQFQVPPTSDSRYRVPDLLGIFEYRGHTFPLLIEVKSSKRRQLSWRPDYFEGLRRYGEVLGIPVLVAWKSMMRGAWFLVDLDRFQRAKTNYRLTFETAAKSNLLGVLGGDFIVDLPPGLGMRFEFKKLKTLGREVQGDETTEEVLLEVVDASFRTPSGERLEKLGAGLWPLFLASGPIDEMIPTDEGYQVNFFVPPDGRFTWAHIALTTILAFRADTHGPEKPVPWRDLLQTRLFPITVTAVVEAASSGIKEGTVRYILHQQPDVMPSFLREEG